jgi:prophage maintenance system killer protein
MSIDQLVFLDVVAAVEFGGSGAGEIERELVEEALGRPVASFAGELLYGTPFGRAAAMMDSLVAARRRPLAALAGAFWLEREGYRLEAEPAQLLHTIHGVAAGALDVDALAQWLDASSRPL